MPAPVRYIFLERKFITIRAERAAFCRMEELVKKTKGNVLAYHASYKHRDIISRTDMVAAPPKEMIEPMTAAILQIYNNKYVKKFLLKKFIFGTY